MKFSELQIHPDLIRAATEAGYTDLTPIQEQCLAPGLEKRDIAGIAQTGTGKTVAFLLPTLHHILNDSLEGPAALVLTPTRELCLQIAEEATRLCKHQQVRVCSIYGGEGYHRQEAELRENPHLIVATPGRLIDYFKQDKIDTSRIQFLILDEADRMFDMGFIKDVRFIMRRIPESSQTMLFSATLSYYVMRLASDFMKDPVEVRIESESVAVDKIDQKLLHLGRAEKLNYMTNQLLAEKEQIRAIVFTNLRSMVPRIANHLQRYGISAVGLSSLLDQKKRIKLLKEFKLGHFNVLVATDVASRGIDVDDVSIVFNYDLPQDCESYVHRIGRTARAGRSGRSYSFCSEDTYTYLPKIERYLGRKIEVMPIDPEFLKAPVGDFTPAESARAAMFNESDEAGGGAARGRERSGRSGDGRSQRGGTAGEDAGRPPRRRGSRGGQGRSQEQKTEASTAAADTATPAKSRHTAKDDAPRTVRELDREALLRRMSGEPAPKEEAAASDRKRPEHSRSVDGDGDDGRKRSGRRRRGGKRRGEGESEGENKGRSERKERSGGGGGQSSSGRKRRRPPADTAPKSTASSSSSASSGGVIKKILSIFSKK